MSFYDNVSKRAARAIKKRGASMTLRRTIQGAIDANTGLTAASTTVDYSCYGIIQYFDTKASALMYGTSTLKDSLIKKEDQMILLQSDGLDIVPNEVTDSLIHGTTNYTIVNILTLQPGGEAILYNVHVRK